MQEALSAVIPVFLVIALGRWFRHIHMPGDDFWPKAEKITYHVFLPLLFFVTIAKGNYDAIPHIRELLAAIAGAMLGNALLSWLAGRWILKMDGKSYSCLLQGSVRFNNYVGIPVILSAFGQEGLVTYAAVIALAIPLSTFISVWGFCHYASHEPVNLRKLFRSIMTNPLIVASLLGLVVNRLQIPLPWVMDSFEMMAKASVALGLLTVGVAMDGKTLIHARRDLLVICLLKQLCHPALMWLLGTWLGLPPLLLGVAIVYAALPSAASCYVLARQFHANAPLMAAMIVATTLASLFALSGLIYLWG